MAKNSTLPESSPADGAQPDATPSYEVGYGRPPLQSRFKPGHRSRGGRRKGSRNKRTVVDETLNEKIRIREGNRTRSVTKFAAMILRMTNDAVSGNAKAQSNVISIVRSMDLLEEPQDAAAAAPLTSDDEALISDFLARHGNQVASTQTAENAEHPGTKKAGTPSQQSEEPKS